MKRSKFFKTLGLGITVAAITPSLLKGGDGEVIVDEVNNAEYINPGNWKYMELNVTNLDGSDAEINNVSMRIKNKSRCYELSEGDGLNTVGNHIEIDTWLEYGEYNYELVSNNEIITIGKLKI